MNVECSNCPAKYAVPDDKVRGKKVRITCKRCSAPIIVDGTQLGAPSTESKRKQTMLGGIEAPTSAGPAAPPRPSPPAPPEQEPWTVAVTEEDQREMTTEQVVETYANGLIDEETFVWRDGMDDWLTPFEIPEIAAALTREGFAPPDNRDSLPAIPPDPDGPVGGFGDPPQGQSGAWREPAKWEPESDPAGNVSFDDVTVAMEAPKAQALLEATEREEAAAPTPAPSAPEHGYEDDEATVVAEASRLTGGFEEDEAPRAPRPAAGMPAPLEESTVASPELDAPFFPQPQPAAAVRDDRVGDAGPDLFAGFAQAGADDALPAPRERMPTIPPEPAPEPGGLTGARNETSVLFSLDQLAHPKSATGPQQPTDAGILLAESDRRAAATDDAPSSVAKLESPGLFSAMSVPDVTAPAPPSAPSSPKPRSSTAAPESKNRTGLWVILGLVLAASVGGGYYVVNQRQARTLPTAEPPEAKPLGTTSPSPAQSSVLPPSQTSTEPTQAPPAGSASASASAASPEPPDQTGTAPSRTAETAAASKEPAAATEETEGNSREAPTAEAPPFDVGAASSAMSSAAASAAGSCKQPDGPMGSGKVSVTFVNSGRATRAVVGGDFAGTSVGGCIARVFRDVSVPAFGGEPRRVSKTVSIQ